MFNCMQGLNKTNNNQLMSQCTSYDALYTVQRDTIESALTGFVILTLMVTATLCVHTE